MSRGLGSAWVRTIIAEAQPERIMLDLHCHILPEVDDGAASLAEAFALARFAVNDGITHVVATPHCHRQCRMLRADVLPRVKKLNEDLAREVIPLTVLPGSEIQVVDADEFRREFEAGLYCHLGDRREYTLLEFPWRAEDYPDGAPELIAWLRARGFRPIIAHPERHPHFTSTPGRLQALVDAGAWLQITVDSLLGKHGVAALAAGEQTLRTYLDAVLASDAHNQRRCSGISAGLTWVREHLGADRADDLRARTDRILADLVRED